jgi:hypothetical protein
MNITGCVQEESGIYVEARRKIIQLKEYPGRV